MKFDNLIQDFNKNEVNPYSSHEGYNYELEDEK